MDNCTIDIDTRITDSIIGANSEIMTNKKRPKGHRLVVGENARVIF